MRNYYCNFTVISFVTISFHKTAKGQGSGSLQKRMALESVLVA